MEQEIKKRMRAIDTLAMGDDAYYAMLREIRVLEKQYDSVLESLSPAQQDIVCDYLSLCEAMNLRKLEIACKYLHFPE